MSFLQFLKKHEDANSYRDYNSASNAGNHSATHVVPIVFQIANSSANHHNADFANNSRQNGDHHEVAAKKLSKMSLANRPLRCTALYWLFFLLVLVLSIAVLVLDRSCDCIILSRSTRGQ